MYDCWETVVGHHNDGRFMTGYRFFLGENKAIPDWFEGRLKLNSLDSHGRCCHQNVQRQYCCTLRDIRVATAFKTNSIRFVGFCIGSYRTNGDNGKNAFRTDNGKNECPRCIKKNLVAES